MGDIENRRRGQHEQGISFQLQRLVGDLERISLDPRTVLEAWIENTEAFETVALHQERVRSREQKELGNEIRRFAAELESAVHGLTLDDKDERLLNVKQLRDQIPRFYSASGTIPFENEPRICVRFKEEPNEGENA